MIARIEYDNIIKNLNKEKAIILLGPRQVGKTTLVRSFTSLDGSTPLYWNGDEPDVREWLPKASSTRLRELIGQRQLLIIDEAQRIENIGLVIKLIVDQIPHVQVIATGSSALDLSSALQEPLTGRKYMHHMYPLSFAEMAHHHGELDEIRLLEQRLLFGYYPDVVNHPEDAETHIKLLAESYLFKDILALGKVSKPRLLENIVKAVALQVGSEVSSTEIASLVSTDRNTVERYLDLLEKAYVIFTLPALSRNVRNEIKKGRKIYFWDCGIRNAVLGNFSPLSTRTDLGALWENYLISERFKHNAYLDAKHHQYFWRTTQQQEIDYIEELPSGFHAYEFKWNSKGSARIPKTFLGNYQVEQSMIIDRHNYSSFLLGR